MLQNRNNRIVNEPAEPGPNISREDPPVDGLNHAGIFLLLLISADAVFVIVHLLHISGLSGNDLYSLKRDRGYAEVFQYVKAFWIVIMLGALWWRTRESIYGTWLLLYAYLVCDDAFQLHEHGGAVIVRYWGYDERGLVAQEGALSLRRQDFGELAVLGAIGLLFLGLISLTYLRTARDARNASKDLALLSGLILFFGVAIDILHSVAGEHGFVEGLLGVVEDGGEMFAMSVACWYVFELLRHGGKVPTPVWRRAMRAGVLVESG